MRRSEDRQQPDGKMGEIYKQLKHKRGNYIGQSLDKRMFTHILNKEIQQKAREDVAATGTGSWWVGRVTAWSY